MRFFTDKTVENEYLMIKIEDYLKLEDKSKWDEILIDPHVNELKKSDKYSWEGKIDIYQFLDSLPNNHYFSWDYPSDMNLKYQDLFLEKTWNNALKFHKHSQYIVTVQAKFRHYWDFVEWFDKYNTLEIKSGILALGNQGGYRTLTNYLKHIYDYTFSHCKHPRIHIYGLCLKAIPYAYKLSKRFNVELSVDSTNWTRACNKKLKEKYNNRVSCRSNNRQEFFNKYLKTIRKKGVKLENEK